MLREQVTESHLNTEIGFTSSSFPVEADDSLRTKRIQLYWIELIVDQLDVEVLVSSNDQFLVTDFRYELPNAILIFLEAFSSFF